MPFWAGYLTVLLLLLLLLTPGEGVTDSASRILSLTSVHHELENHFYSDVSCPASRDWSQWMNYTLPDQLHMNTDKIKTSCSALLQ